MELLYMILFKNYKPNDIWEERSFVIRRWHPDSMAFYPVKTGSTSISR